MRISVRRHAAALMSAAVLLTGTAALLPGHHAGASAPAATVYAAEADYPWSTYLKKSADWFGTSEAITVADACIQYQVSGEGGWQKGMGTEHTGDWAHSTVDNDATTSQIRFLMRTYAATGQQKYFDCAMRGVDCLFKMQYANGGFMQCLNTPGTYHAHITLNDGAYVHIMSILKEMKNKSGDFTKISDSYAQKAAQSFDKAIQCLLDMQITVNGTKTAWCQQHDENNLAPASARAYELPSICTSESAGIVQFLYTEAQETGRADLAASVNAAIEWFKKAALYGIKFDWNSDKSDKVVTQVDGGGPIWARFYTLDTEKPMFADRDGKAYSDVSQISQERRTGYAWYGSWGNNVIKLPLLTGTPVEEPTYQGELISSLTVHDLANGGDWSIQENLGVGSQIYGDRDFTLSIIPHELVGAEYVRTACDSKTFSGDLAELTAAQDITVYVLTDMRLLTEQGINLPWVSHWDRTSMLAANSNTVEYIIYAVNLKAGESITLGSNMTGQNVVNYFAAVQPRSAETTTTTAATVTTTTTTTTAAVTTTTATTASEISVITNTNVILPERNTDVTVTCISDSDIPVFDESGIYRGTNALWDVHLELVTQPKIKTPVELPIDLSGIKVNLIEQRSFNIYAHDVSGMLYVQEIGVLDGSDTNIYYIDLNTDYSIDEWSNGIQPLRLLIGEEPEKHTGDVNCDGETDVKDAVLLARYLGNDEVKMEEQNLINAETDGKGNVTMDDLTVLLRYIVHFIKEFPV